MVGVMPLPVACVALSRRSAGSTTVTFLRFVMPYSHTSMTCQHSQEGPAAEPKIVSDSVLFEDCAAVGLYARQGLQESFAIRHPLPVLFAVPPAEDSAQ